MPCACASCRACTSAHGSCCAMGDGQFGRYWQARRGAIFLRAGGLIGCVAPKSCTAFACAVAAGRGYTCMHACKCMLMRATPLSVDERVVSRFDLRCARARETCSPRLVDLKVSEILRVSSLSLSCIETRDLADAVEGRNRTLERRFGIRSIRGVSSALLSRARVSTGRRLARPSSRPPRESGLDCRTSRRHGAPLSNVDRTR